jgi:hypothetical protein
VDIRRIANSIAFLEEQFHVGTIFS